MANSTVTPPSPPARLQGPSAEPAAAPQEHITNLHPFLQPAPGPAPGAGAAIQLVPKHLNPKPYWAAALPNPYSTESHERPLPVTHLHLAVIRSTALHGVCLTAGSTCLSRPSIAPAIIHFLTHRCCLRCAGHRASSCTIRAALSCSSRRRGQPSPSSRSSDPTRYPSPARGQLLLQLGCCLGSRLHNARHLCVLTAKAWLPPCARPQPCASPDQQLPCVRAAPASKPPVTVPALNAASGADRGATQQVSVTEPDVPPPSPNSLPAGLSTPSGLDSESTKEAVGSGVGSTAAVGNSASHIAVPVLVAVAVVGAVAGGAFWYVRRSRRGYSRWSGLRDTEMSML